MARFSSGMTMSGLALAASVPIASTRTARAKNSITFAGQYRHSGRKALGKRAHEERHSGFAALRCPIIILPERGFASPVLGDNLAAFPMGCRGAMA